MTKKGRKTCLRIKVDRQHAISAKRQILGEMRGRRGLSATALEIHHRDNLQGFAVFPMRNITSRAFAAAIEFNAKRVYVLDGIGSTIIWLSRRPLPFRYELTQIPFVDADELGGFGGENRRMVFCAAGGKSRSCWARSRIESSAASALISARKSPRVFSRGIVDVSIRLPRICGNLSWSPQNALIQELCPILSKPQGLFR